MQYQVKYIIAQVGVEPTSLGYEPSKLPLLYRTKRCPKLGQCHGSTCVFIFRRTTDVI